MTGTGVEPPTTYLLKKHSTIWRNQRNDWAELSVGICTEHLAVSRYHVMYGFQSESTFGNCLNVKEFLAQHRRVIWSLGERNETRTDINLGRKQKLNHFVKLNQKFSSIARIYLYGSFNFMLSSYHVRISEWIYTLRQPEYQRNLLSKQERYLKFNWLQRNSNPQPPTS